MISEARKEPKKVKMGRLEALTAAKEHVLKKIEEGVSRDEALEAGAKIVSHNTGRSKARERDALVDFIGKALVGTGSEESDSKGLMA